MVRSEARTLTDAVAVLPVLPPVALTVPVVLTWLPAAVAVTFTEKLQELLMAIVPAVRLMLCEPAEAVTIPTPHVPVRPLGVDTTNPEGRLSTNATPFRGVVVFGLVIVKVSEVALLKGIDVAPNALLIVGGVTTVRVKICETDPTLLSAVIVRL
jgi:hypothetical protein